MRFDSIPSDPPNVLLVGSGAVGSVIARHLCGSDAVGDVLLADVNGVLAKQTAARLQSRKAGAMQLDATDTSALRQAMQGGGIVINAALPRFNRVIQAAALAERLHYVDLANDFVDPFADTERWTEAGLTALCAMGEDPGISNVFARHAANALDRVDSIKVRDGDSASSPDYPFIALFSPETFIEETRAPSRIWRDGKYYAPWTTRRRCPQASSHRTRNISDTAPYSASNTSPPRPSSRSEVSNLSSASCRDGERNPRH